MHTKRLSVHSRDRQEHLEYISWSPGSRRETGWQAIMVRLEGTKRTMPTLYIVATPIGNLEDVTMRAIRILREVSLIAAEDTRKTKRLLSTYDITTPLTSFHEHSGRGGVAKVMRRLEDGDVALVSEAGMPAISDPGHDLVGAAIEAGISVVPVPGASAVTSALAVSGLATDRFHYLGFLPAKSSARRRYLADAATETATLVIFEAPHRLAASLRDMLEMLGDRRVAVCRELTKLHEEVFRGTLAAALEHFVAPRGEFTIIIAGSPEPEPPQMTEGIEQRLAEFRAGGAPAREAVAAVSGETGLSRRELYRAWLRLG
jgi:16S rRNA (cytidine1402-2'-O)-methyltransferase